MVISQRTPLTFRIVISKFFVCALTSFLLSILVGVPLGSSSYFTVVEDIAARGVPLPLPESVQDLVRSVRSPLIIFVFTVITVRTFLAYNRLLEAD